MINYAEEPWTYTPHHLTAIGTDTETSGLKVGEHGIVEIGAIAHNHRGQILGYFHSYVYPGIVTFDERAMEINGIDPVTIYNSPHICEVLPQYVGFLMDWYQEEAWYNGYTQKHGVVPRTHLVGHNLQFDLKHITYAISIFTPWLMKDFEKVARNQFDTQQHSPVGERQLTLGTLGRHYNVPNKAPHSVIGDIDQTLGIYHQILGKERLSERLIEQYISTQQLV